MTGYKSKREAALDEEGMYLVHHTKRKDDDDDAQGYIAEYESALQKEYQRGYEAGKAAQPAKEPDAIGCQCAECGEWQKWTPSGMVCKNGHGGASGINQRLYTTPPAQPAQEPRLDQGPDYERGFVDGMQKQMQSSVDKAVNRMAQRPWVGLSSVDFNDFNPLFAAEAAARWAEAKLKENNGG